MKNFKKLFISIIKIATSIFLILFLILFFYSAFFYKPSTFIVENDIINADSVNDLIEEEKKKLGGEEQEILKTENEEQNKLNEILKNKKKNKITTNIKDGLYAIIGDKVITKSDILNEIKRILVLNNMTYTDDKKNILQKMAIKSAIKRSVKEMEVELNDRLEFSDDDLSRELLRLASNLNVDIDTFKKICEANDLDFSVIEDRLKTDLLWNSLIFYTYRDKVTISLEEIDEQLKLNLRQSYIYEYLVSEIVINQVEKSEFKSTIEKLNNIIKNEGFENAAMDLSLSQSAINGGDLGWVTENKINKNFLPEISRTLKGELTKPILLNDGILIFKIRDKRKIKVEQDLEKLKDQLVNAEKTKMLNMFSESHFDNLRRQVQIKYFNE